MTTHYVVLILVVVDNGLVRFKGFTCDIETLCLNPCCSGQWSRTVAAYATSKARRVVLILVVVDNGLVPIKVATKYIDYVVLILVVVDNGLVLKETRNFTAEEMS